ncbi:DNA ligase 1-like isoform X2 [Octopus sinensis]|uniref:DNA ligase 1-like isoform X2 n=1 Tax=Octopus sinensis TaxID=2607531 RepID=A0A7E6ETM0_9MOLL|nr:DNA ligase 1-like isoform X2 [Octopus sinensis]
MIPIWLLIYFVMCNGFVSQSCLPSSNAHYKVDNKTDISSSSFNKRIFLFAETFTSFLRKFILGNSQNKLKFLRQKRKTLHDEDSIDKLVSQVRDLTQKTKVVRTGNGNKTSNIMRNNGSDVANNLLKALTKLIQGKQTDVTVRNEEDNRKNMSKIVISYKYQGKKSNVDKDVYDDEEEVEEEKFEADKEEEDEEVEDDVEKEKKEKLKKNVLKEMESTLGLTAEKVKKDKTFTTIIMKQTIIINKTLPDAKTHKVYKTKGKVLNGLNGKSKTKAKILNRLKGKYGDFKFPKSHSDRKGVPSSKHKNYMHNISFPPILPSDKERTLHTGSSEQT